MLRKLLSSTTTLIVLISSLVALFLVYVFLPLGETLGTIVLFLAGVSMILLITSIVFKILYLIYDKADKKNKEFFEKRGEKAPVATKRDIAVIVAAIIIGTVFNMIYPLHPIKDALFFWSEVAIIIVVLGLYAKFFYGK